MIQTWETRLAIYGDALMTNAMIQNAMQEEIDALRAENESLRQDAERYRWLLDYGKPALWHQCARLDSYDDVERVIDAAMEGK